MGRYVVCINQEKIMPYIIQPPQSIIPFNPQLQHHWIVSEVSEFQNLIVDLYENILSGLVLCFKHNISPGVAHNGNDSSEYSLTPDEHMLIEQWEAELQAQNQDLRFSI